MVDAQWAVFGAALAAAIGAGSSLATTWLNAILARRDPDKAYTDAVKYLLVKLLDEPNDKWREIKEISNTIGLDEQKTKEYLIISGARGSEEDGRKWGLISRNPIAPNIKPPQH